MNANQTQTQHEVTHTPCPWRFRNSYTGGLTVYATRNPQSSCGETVAHDHICEIDASTIAEANARLIAAAPSLLSTLQECEKMLRLAADALRSAKMTGTPSCYELVADAARQAISRATGNP